MNVRNINYKIKNDKVYNFLGIKVAEVENGCVMFRKTPLLQMVYRQLNIWYILRFNNEYRTAYCNPERIIPRDKYGWPVVKIQGKPFTNTIRLLIHTDIKQTLKRRGD